jgi:hypothetical protein
MPGWSRDSRFRKTSVGGGSAGCMFRHGGDRRLRANDASIVVPARAGQGRSERGERKADVDLGTLAVLGACVWRGVPATPDSLCCGRAVGIRVHAWLGA